MELEAFARRFGLTAARHSAGTSFERGGVRVVHGFADEAPGSIEDRNRAMCACLGIRLGIDRLLSADERLPATGERSMRLVPNAALQLAARIADFVPLTGAWVEGAPFSRAAILEVGRHQHLLGVDDIELTATDNVLEATRRVLFYSAYSLRPQRSETNDGARVHRFEATGGLGSSLGALFPDYDLDSARAGGAVMFPSYDVAVVWRPGPDTRPSTFRGIGRRALAQTAMPFSRRVFHLNEDGMVVGATVDARAELDPSDLCEKLVDVANA